MKKSKRSHVVFLSVLLVLVAAALWYTRPVSLRETLDVERLVSVEASLMTPRYIPEANGTTIRQDLTELSVSADDPAAIALLDKLDSISGHASLLGILFRTHSVYDQDGTLSLSFRTEDDAVELLLLCNSKYLYWERNAADSSRSRRAYAVDESIFAVLAALVKEHGTCSGTTQQSFQYNS